MSREEEKPVFIGGQGVIYLVKDAKKLLVKKVPQSENILTILREAENIKLTNHNNENPHLISTLGIDAEDHGIILEFMNCGNFLEFLKLHQGKDNQLSLKVYLSIALQALRGLESIHSKNLVYLDFKGENILLDFKNDQVRVKLCDLASAVPKGTDHDDYYKHVSVLYAPPEILSLVCEVKANPAIDIFSFGLFLQEIIEGRRIPLRSTLFSEQPKVNERIIELQKTLSEEEVKILNTFAYLQKSCIDNWEKRPSVTAIIQILEKCANKVGGIEKINKSLKDALEKYKLDYQSKNPLPSLDNIPQVKFETGQVIFHVQSKSESRNNLVPNNESTEKPTIDIKPRTEHSKAMGQFYRFLSSLSKQKKADSFSKLIPSPINQKNS